LVKVAYPSKDWGWALQWVNKNQISVDLHLQKKDDSPGSLDQSKTESCEKDDDQISLKKQNSQRLQDSQLDAAHSLSHMGRIVDELRHGRRTNLSITELIGRQNQIQNALNNVFSGIHESGFRYAEDKLNQRNPKQRIARDVLQALSHKDGQEFEESEAKEYNYEKMQSYMNELDEQLKKYIVLHCAKVELSLIDVASGTTFSPMSTINLKPKAQSRRKQFMVSNEDDLMHIILRQNVLNQMYFEDMPFGRSINMLNQSRYLFLEFIPLFSLILVGNQGAHDLHFFKIVNKIEINANNKHELFQRQDLHLERVYVYKHSNYQERILGVNVQEDASSKIRIYILTSDNLLNCLEIRASDQQSQPNAQ